MAPERVAENILEDLFTTVLDWPLSDVNNQVGYADLVLTSQGLKYLILEAKRPGALAWNRRAVEAALDQALRYAAEQKVRHIGVSDGDALLHPKYALPARCFAYVGDACAPATWKLPYRLANSDVDMKRLPKAIQAILSNYRGAKVSGIPEQCGRGWEGLWTIHFTSWLTSATNSCKVGRQVNKTVCPNFSV